MHDAPFVSGDPATAAGDGGVAAGDGFEPVIPLAELPADTLVAVRLADGTPVCLVLLDGTVHAVHDCCTHQAFPMSAGELLPDGSLECAWHGARFDPATGQPRRGPACAALRIYRVLVDGGIVHVAGSP